MRHILVIVGAMLATVGVPASAHHSFAVQYDSNKPMAVKGAVTKVEWTNPHARFYVDVRDDKGAVKNWNFELASPNVLVRNGWKPNTLKVGDQIAVTGFLARLTPENGPQMAIASSVTAPDGRKLFASATQDLAPDTAR
jgi:hypothetical protein